MIGQFFQWNTYITPKAVRIVYYLTLVLVALGVLSGLGVSMTYFRYFGFFAGLMTLLATLIAGVIGLVAARIGAELVLIFFKIEDHLGAIRNRTQG